MEIYYEIVITVNDLQQNLLLLPTNNLYLLSDTMLFTYLIKIENITLKFNASEALF